MNSYVHDCFLHIFILFLNCINIFLYLSRFDRRRILQFKMEVLFYGYNVICFSSQCARGDGDSGQASSGSEWTGGGGSGGPCGSSGGRSASPSSSTPARPSSAPALPPPRSPPWAPRPLARDVEPWQRSASTTNLA